MNQKWDLVIQGNTHTVSYFEGDRKNKSKLTVDEKEIEIPKNFKTIFVGIDHPIIIDGKECRFVSVFKNCDIVVDGEYVDNKIRYTPLKIPFWAWIFVLLSYLIPIIALGGAIPTLIACLSSIWCLRFSSNPFIKSGKKLLYNILVVISAWLLFGLLLFGLSD